MQPLAPDIYRSDDQNIGDTALHFMRLYLDIGNYDVVISSVDNLLREPNITLDDTIAARCYEHRALRALGRETEAYIAALHARMAWSSAVNRNHVLHLDTARMLADLPAFCTNYGAIPSAQHLC